MGTAIVAIPREDDAVWRLSSQKIPHMTILFLGDQEENPKLIQIVEFLEHATKTTLKRFGLSVDRRGELGEDKADVLFFDKNYEFKNVNEFRSFLLANDAISEAYNSVEQFPEWTPHLTMGYPETPAKEDNREYPGISYVGFDRIAVWVGDFDGPEFRLADRFESNVLEMSSDSQDAVDDILEHFGVKGMKWGYKKDESLAPESKKTIVTNYEPKVGGGTVDDQHHLALITKVEKGGPDKIKAAEKTLGRRLLPNENVYTITTENYNQRRLKDSKARKRVEAGGRVGDALLVGLDKIDRWAQMSDTPEDVLEHFGIRGMKWGVRRKNPSSSSPATPASSDAARSHAIQKSISRHGLRAVSNEELKLLNERVQLEQRYSQLFPKKKSVVKMGKEFAWDIIEPVAKQQAKAFLNAQADLKINGPLEIGRHMKKK